MNHLKWIEEQIPQRCLGGLAQCNSTDSEAIRSNFPYQPDTENRYCGMLKELFEHLSKEALSFN